MTLTAVAGQQVSGTGIPSGTTVATVTDAGDFTLSQPATASGVQALTIGAEPVTLTEAKQWARVEFPDDDSLIGDIIRATREWCEGVELKRSIMLQARTYYSMGFPWSGGYYNRIIRSMGPSPWWLPTSQGIIQVPYPNLQQIIAIRYIDPSSGTLLTIPSSQYLFTPGSVPARIQPQYGQVWPLTRSVIDSVQITYSAGYGPMETDVPASARLAMRSMIAATYENRESYMDSGELTVTPMALRFMDVERWGVYT